MLILCLYICARADGSYESVGNVVSAIGGVAAVVSMGAGAAIAAIGALISALGDLDPDDDLGTHNFTFNGASNLHSSVGTHLRNFNGDGADYDVNFQLIELLA